MANYEQLLFENNIYYNDLKTALDLVKAFVIAKKLTLVGGMSMDLALKLKGGFIYDKDAQPIADYDMISSEHYKDAIELGNILCDKGLKNVSVINGMHTTTMRVRVNFVAVADISYCPTAILKTIKTLRWENINIVHPHNQIIDQHHALCYPFENLYSPVILNRFTKDIIRYNLILELYPIPVPVFENDTQYNISIPVTLLSDQCIAGYAAQYLYSINISTSICGLSNNILFKMNSPMFDLHCNLFDYTVKSFVEHFDVKTVTYYNAILNRLPRRAEFIVNAHGNDITIRIFDNSNLQVSAVQITVKGHNIFIIHMQHILLQHMHFEDYGNYNAVIALCIAAEHDLKDKSKRDLVSTINTYGSSNFGHSMQFQIETFDDPDAKNQIPKNLYPTDDSCASNGKFDYLSRYFAIDGAKLN